MHCICDGVIANQPRLRLLGIHCPGEDSDTVFTERIKKNLRVEAKGQLTLTKNGAACNSVTRLS